MLKYKWLILNKYGLTNFKPIWTMEIISAKWQRGKKQQ